MTTKLYLYRTLLEDNFNFDDTPGIFSSKKWNLIGFDRHFWRDNNIRNLAKTINIKPFEVRQNNFDLVLSYASKFNIKIVKLTFSDDLSESEHKKLIGLLRNENIESLLDFIDEQRFEFENDIEEITFYLKDFPSYHNISFSRDGILTLDLDKEKLENIISNETIGMLSGNYIPQH